MGFLGRGALVAWHDMQSGAEPDHDHWHSHEHLAERLRIDGFNRGRRCRGLSDSPLSDSPLSDSTLSDSTLSDSTQFFIMYEVDDLAVLRSEAYHARLNAPTDWTRRIVPTIRNMNRTLCRVLHSAGNGVGAFVLSVRVSSQADSRERLLSGLQEQTRSLAEREGVVAAHLLEGDAEASGVKTDEMRLRGGADGFTELALIVEGYELAALQRLAGESLSTDTLRVLGAVDCRHDFHQLAHLMTRDDLASDNLAKEG